MFTSHSVGFRFWIGEIDKMLKVRNGRKERIFQRIELTLLPADAGKDDVLTAKEYVYCPPSENREYISAEYLRYIVQMEDSHQKQYETIDSDDLDVLGKIIAEKSSEERENTFLSNNIFCLKKRLLEKTVQSGERKLRMM